MMTHFRLGCAKMIFFFFQVTTECVAGHTAQDLCGCGPMLVYP